MSLENKVVLVTGAGRGIGAGIAKCFAQHGAKVAVTDLSQELADSSAAALDTQSMGIVADAANQNSMAEAIDLVASKLGQLDILVNNAGIGGLNVEAQELSPASAFLGLSDDNWDEQLHYNLRTAFSSTHAAISRIRDGGSIINIASIAALSPTPMLPAYGAAKAAVAHLTRTLAVDLASRKIRVNCICPGIIWTRAWELLADGMKARQSEFANMSQRQIFEVVIENAAPLGEEQTPEDIGNLAVFFASDQARQITGQVVAVDGGISLGQMG